MAGFEESSYALFSKIVSWGFIGIIIFVLIVAGGTALWFWWRKKKWNMKVVFKMPRANGGLLCEIGKGHYDVKSGIIDLKRRGIKPIGMKPFDVRQFLQGDVLEVLLLSPTDAIPIVQKSYEKISYNDPVTGTQKECVVAKIETDLLKRRTWKNYFEREAKNRFTLLGFLDKHWQAISLGIVMFSMFIGFAVLWSKIKA